ncbi:helix-turn-helix transcriptional regulator [Kineosporia babensis]|uniref:Helix-turn-helix transcriptional regulator n=1 Tax=Kineosporia babensis TaxID=499548 RepID=A0A9X1NM17_9ACTN|nr:helix-turn-helix transcriptional regulator [Kineosporia babensis]
MVSSPDPAPTFPEQLRRHRVAARLTQEQLAAKAGLNVRSVSQLERGKVRYPRPESVRLLGQALNLAEDELAAFTELARAQWWADHEPSAPASLMPAPRPTQLPGAIPGFTGRKAELRQLDQLLELTHSDAVVIGVVSGPGGVGKTTLALNWTHTAASRFPDGQLYADLRGFDRSGTVAAPSEILRGFLQALGIAAGSVPASLEQRAALYRSLLSNRRILVVLDNARDSDQVRALLPGGSGGLTLVTSRNQLTSLAATSGARLLRLEPLPTAQAQELLTARLGLQRITAEPDAVERIVDACGGLPLALAVAAARAQQSSFPLAVLAADLGQSARRLTVLEAGDEVSDVRAVFSWSFEAISISAARLFRLLGLHPGPDISLPAAAALSGRPTAEVGRLLTELARASLLGERLPGRYHLHDLLRVYAGELSEALEERRTAITRLLQHYTHTAFSAARMIDPTHDPIEIPLGTALAEAGPIDITDEQQALEWIGGELPSLLAAVHLSAQAGLDDLAWQLAWTLESYLRRQARWNDLRAVTDVGLGAAERLGNPAAQGYSQLVMATAAAELSQFAQAHAHLREALERYARAGERPAQLGQARTHRMIGWVHELRDEHEEALAHVRLSLAGYRAAGHRDGEMFALNAVGWGLTLTGQHAEAVLSCRQALALAEEAADRSAQAMILDSIALAEHHLGNYPTAIDCYRRAADLFRELASPRGEGSTLARLADSQAAVGDLAAADVTYQQALHLLRAQNHPDTAAVLKRFADLPLAPREVPPG